MEELDSTPFYTKTEKLIKFKIAYCLIYWNLRKCLKIAYTTGNGALRGNKWCIFIKVSTYKIPVVDSDWRSLKISHFYMNFPFKSWIKHEFGNFENP